MDYEKKYKDALIWMASLYDGLHGKTKEEAERFFPELKENRDERIRIGLIRLVNTSYYHLYPYIPTKEEYVDMIDWLEKQGKKTQGKPALDAIKEEKVDNANKIEPTFKAGDWITIDKLRICQIISINDIGNYIVQYCDDEKTHILSKKFCESHFHLWSIAEANEGDVLASKDGDNILIFRNLDTATGFSSYYNLRGKGELGWSNKSFIPATKEQRDILFSKMKESGYEWDAEKKELKKAIIEPKFKIGDWIACNKFNIAKIIDINDDRYKVEFIDGHRGIPYIDYIDRNLHLWTIQDAREGDVLVHNGCTFIFMGIKDGIVQAIETTMLGLVNFGEPDKDTDYFPATKEQRELFFKKMEEEGYKWDAEKKELTLSLERDGGLMILLRENQPF